MVIRPICVICVPSVRFACAGRTHRGASLQRGCIQGGPTPPLHETRTAFPTTHTIKKDAPCGASLHRKPQINLCLSVQSVLSVCRRPTPLKARASMPACYQMETRSATGRNIGSFSVMPKASYQAAMWGSAPFTRHSPSECTSILVICSTASGRMLLAHTPA